ncbi:MAG: DUF4982 domain-containing protein [Ruminiclostridium sp.]|nr:DUF4982 domain-containing protein [Ruminiclostridium sp.]
MTRRLFCDNWEFAETPLFTEYEDASGWRRVDIPHDWLIYDVKALYRDSTGWYRRRYTHKNDGLRTVLRFEGVYMDSSVYVNGVRAFEWKNGYTTFDADITGYLREGENLIAVRADHRAPNSRWYSGAGIYRNVWLCRYPETHILPDGVYITADEGVTVTVEAERPAGVTVDGLTIHTAIYDGDKLLAQTESPCLAADSGELPAPAVRGGCRYSINTHKLYTDDPVRWDIDAPKLYDCLTELKQNGEVIDSRVTRFGFREMRFTPDKGFFLNGRQVKIHGVCEHHDLGALGAAMNKDAMRRKLTKLRTMGVNAIRTAHNPPATELMELCDEMGFLVLSEFTDVWEIPKTEFDYVRFAKDWRERDIASWVRRDRNHPCLIGWSIGNEIPDTGADEHGQELTTLMRRLVRQSDPRGNGAVTIGSNQMRTVNGQKCADILGVAGYNYAEELYERDHAERPQRCIYGSETSSIVTSRGIYHFPLEEANLGDDDGQCSALGNGSPIWAAKNWEWCITKDRDAEFCAGQFIWTGFDYIGEPTPYDSKNSFFGQFDTAGFEKDGAYVFRSAWTDPDTDPFVHIFPHWGGFENGELIDVRVASNLPRVELYLNNKLIKAQEFDRRHGSELLLDARIPHENGTLTAIGYDSGGTERARGSRWDFGEAEYLRAIPDKTVLKADGRDLAFIEITALSESGEVIENANDRVFVEVTGAGRLIGLDNGDSADFEQYKGTSRRLFSGKLLAIVAAKDHPGRIDVKLTSPVAEPTVVVLTAEAAGVPEGISCIEENSHTEADCPDETHDIPVTRIVLKSESRTFTPERRVMRFDVCRRPVDAVYNDITYRLTGANGIDSKLARIVSSDDDSVTVECLGDGEFYLRALCRNGTDRVRLMNSVRLTGEGLGNAFHDPYELVEAGLCTLTGGDVKNGIDHGMRFGLTGGWFGTENVDFGDTGSDTVTIPVFAEVSTPFPISIYDGTPDSGELLGVYEYCEPSEWLVYKPETYKLKKLLKGVHTISIAGSCKFDVKGFVFEKRSRERSELFAAEARVYGDSYTVSGSDVTGIGNNVIADFGEFDFTDFTPSRLVITGRTKLPFNSIQAAFECDDKRTVLCDFARSEEYTAREFPLDGIKGRVRLSLIFLPGCDFDLRSVRFI